MHATLYAITFLAAAFSSVSGAPLDAHPIRQNNTTRTPGVTVSLDGPGFHMDTPASPGLLAKRQTGRIEIHWQFAIITSLSSGCESPGCTSVSPSDHLWVDWYANGADSPCKPVHSLLHSKPKLTILYYTSLLPKLGYHD